MHDLIKDERLARVGGKRLFDKLGAHLVQHSVDNRSIRSVASGSSAEFMMEFARGGLLRDGRMEIYTLADPTPASVRAALTADERYSAEEAASMVDLCGTRMRLLAKPLGPKSDAPTYATFIANMRASATDAFKSAFKVAARSGQSSALATLLDSVNAAEVAGTASPDCDMLPSAFGGGVPSILFLDSTQGLRFQSQLHRRVWEDLHSEYLARGTGSGGKTNLA